MKRILAIVASLAIAVNAFADEGMWLLPLIKQLNGKDIKAAGCKLSPEEIYSVNKSSLKDAIVQFGGGCTGEVISDKGLLVTNHHCGYSSIQGLSSDEHNYLMDGYWAKNLGEELPVPGLSVTFLVSMEDITAAYFGAEDKEAFVKQLEEGESSQEEGIDAVVTSFFNNNVYYLIKYRTYSDIRFVGAPPASMGKFGGETDNWMWPRHTCDFSMFRIYSAPDGRPAEYSDENVPYVPVRSLKISLKGVRENDYAMVMGYPGRTQRYQTAAQLEQMISSNRIRIDARTVRQDIMWEAMCANPSVQLKYANKYASSANGWKKWQGEELAFENLGIIAREKEKEAALKAWIEASPERKEKYGDPVAEIAASVEAGKDVQAAFNKVVETLYNIEISSAAISFTNLFERALKQGADTLAALEYAKQPIIEEFKDYDKDLDRKEAKALLEYYRSIASAEDYPQIPGIDYATADFEAYVDALFENSVYPDFETFTAAGPEALLEDPASVLGDAIYKLLIDKLIAARSVDSAPRARQAFAAALLEWQKGKALYPDANFTMRLTYGNVLPYSPADGLQYNYFTTHRGILEKEDPTNPEFIVPARLKELLLAKDFGRWADSDGTLHTCFLTNNDITGGNSGSPVLNAKGELIGLAFDGNWESMSSDVMFEPDLQRCICVDIRYVLFTVEKVGGASNIIEELTLVK